MIVPTPVPFSTLPLGTVYTIDNTAYFIICNATSAVDLQTGALNGAIPPTILVTPLPGARLVLG